MNKNIFADYDHLDRPADVTSHDETLDKPIFEYPENRINSNQGLAHSLNPAMIKMDNFYFRKEYEGAVCRAFADLDIPNFPLPVMCKGRSRSRMETDSMILTEQQFACIELDGDSHNEELALERQWRNKIYHENNVPVFHYQVPHDWNMEWARAVAKDVVDSLKRRRQAAYLSFSNEGGQL